MADKKEILDYLRNRQKAAEIEAKVNGINLWVLLGAIAIVSWQLILSVHTEIFNSQEWILRTLLVVEAIYLGILGLLPAAAIHEEVRYRSQSSPESALALLQIVMGIIFLLPPVLYLLVVGKSLSVFPAGLVGVVLIIFGTSSIVKQVIGSSTEAARLPKPEFNPTRRSAIIGNLVFELMFALTIVEQFFAISRQITSLDSEVLKSLALIAALYLLVITALQRLVRSNGLLWTYELETDLLLDAISPQIALRRIEHRSLGPKLRDVMDNFFDDMDNIFIELEALSADCSAKLKEVPEIPSQYTSERSARIADAIKSPSLRIEEILNECRELSSYLDKLDQLQPGRKRLAIVALLPSLRNRHKVYKERADKAKSELKEMTRSANSSQM